jgi:hypothetical protein
MIKVNIHQANTHSFPASSIWLPAVRKSLLPGPTGSAIGPLPAQRRRAQAGSQRGKIRIKKTFDEPLPKELLDSFTGKS